MAENRIGVAVTAADSNTALAAIEDLEKRGFAAAWMTSGSASGRDSLSVFAAAASRTQRITLGTAITQIFPRHPIAVAQQALVLAQLAPGRFRLGLVHRTTPVPICPLVQKLGKEIEEAETPGLYQQGQRP